MKEEVIVVGGGLSGLSAANKLLSKGFDVTVLEKNHDLGGLAKSFQIKGKKIPVTYRHIQTCDSLTLEYVDKFGLRDKLFWKNVNMVFWWNNRQYRLTQPWHILSFRPLGWFSKIRVGWLGLYCLLKSDWSNMEHKPADEWMREMIGEKATELLFENLAEIKFCLPLSAVSAAWLGNRLHTTVSTKEKYGYLTGGSHQIIDGLAESIRRKGGAIEADAEVTHIGDGFVECGGETITANKIISGVPSQEFLKICDVQTSARKTLESIEYNSIISLVCGSEQLITKEYWSIFLKPRLSFGGLFNHTTLYPEAGLDGEYVYHIFSYHKRTDELYNASEREIADRYLKDLRSICPDFSFKWYRAFKLDYSSPIFSVGYINPPIKFSEKIYLTGAYKEYPLTRTMHTALLSGERTADALIGK